MKLNDAFTQILVIGIIAFCCPGFFNALTGLGGAGAQNPNAGNQANTALYACFAVVGYFGGALYSVLGNRMLMFLGGLTYAIYAAGIYMISNVDGVGWLAPIVGGLLGIGAALFWTSQGAMMMSYSTHHNKGWYIAVFWIIFNLGACVGGFLQFALNYNDPRPKVGDTEGGNNASAVSYFTFVGVMLFGSVASIFLLAAPTKVIKEDGSTPTYESRPVCEEIVGALKVATNKVMLLLSFSFLSSNWFYTYQLNYLNGMLFTVRSRGLNSAFYWGAQMFSAWVIGAILDNEKSSRRTVMLRGYVFVLFWMGLFWALGFVVNYAFEDHWDKDHPLVDWDRIDFTESQRAALPTISMVVGAIGDASLQSFSYWLMGALSGGDTNLSARFAGFYKGIQSAGAAVAWAMDLNKKCTYRIQLIVGFAIWIVASLTQLCAVRMIKEDDENMPEKTAAIDIVRTPSIV